MKRNSILFTLSIFVVLFTSSCNDWLEVPVDGQATSKELFETGDGYRAALNGLYSGMSVPTLYGRELQFGIIDFFSNQYKIDVPETDLKDPLYLAAGKRDFEHKDLQPVLDQIWLKSYKVIAAANDLIKNIQGENSGKFENGEMEKNLILGESKALRAFLHFDLLRLYAPSPVSDDGATYIPYISDFPNISGQRITVREVLTKILADLEEARTLVKPFDDSPLGISGSVSGDARFYNQLTFGMEGANDPSKVDKFFLGRGYRFSYWAITALLARVNQYNAKYDAASLEKAKTYAEEVLNLKVEGSYNAVLTPFEQENFQFMWNDNPEAMYDIRMVSTLIFAGYNEKEQTEASLETYFPREKSSLGASLFIIDKEGQEIFKTVDGIDESGQDIRSTRLIYEPRNSWNNPISTKWYVNENNQEVKNKTITILPLIRTTELRYILAEYNAEKGNFAEAYSILNRMRNNRGLQNSDFAVKTTMADFLKDFVREAQREWISEGQLFYLYKRLNFKVKRRDGSSTPFTKKECVVPIPAGESI